MRTPAEIYAQYKIMPNLQLHQLRVAAVGKTLAEKYDEPVNVRDVILACLFHDMGNIVKFDLNKFPEVLQPEGIGYWEQVKADVVQKYGPEQHIASGAIAREIGLSDTVIEMIGGAGFSKISAIVACDSQELKLVQYADLRVAPHGIVSMQERFDDFARRYAPQKGEDTAALEAGWELESQILWHVSLKPEDLNDVSLAAEVEKLRDYWVSE